MTTQTSSRYCAYLLRCWQEPGAASTGVSAWRFSLEDAHTGERHGFASVKALLAFVRNELRDDGANTPGVQAGEDV